MHVNVILPIPICRLRRREMGMAAHRGKAGGAGPAGAGLEYAMLPESAMLKVRPFRMF